jgi:hypothetical protein
MKKLVCLILLFHSFYTFSQAVDSIYKKYNSGLLHRSGYSIMKGGDKINFLELAKEFSMSDLGLDQFKLFKRKRTTSRVLLFLSVASGFTAAAINNSNQKLAYGFLGGQFILLTGSMAYRQEANKYLDRAIWLRNKDYLFPGR